MDPGSISGMRADFWHVLSTDSASTSRLELKLLLERVSACTREREEEMKGRVKARRRVRRRVRVRVRERRRVTRKVRERMRLMCIDQCDRVLEQ